MVKMLNLIKKISLSLYLLLSSCGVMMVESGYIDPEIAPWVELYKVDKQRFLGTSDTRLIGITFKNIPVDGQCNTRELKNVFGHVIQRYYHIYINPNFWYKSGDTYKMTLIYHEMGHCDMDFEHVSTHTIMNPYGMDDSLFDSNPDFYLEQFFRQGK